MNDTAVKVPLKEGIYFNVTEAEYHSDPCPEPSLSSSISKIILQKSAMHAKAAHPRLNPNYEPDDKPIFNIGKTIHSLVMGDEREFTIVDAKAWNTNAAKAEREAAYTLGKTPILKHKFEALKKMARRAAEQMEAHEESATLIGGRPEVTLVWQDVGGIWCRCRLDKMADTSKDFYDFKSTEASANPAAVSRLIFNMGYDIQASFYKRGIRKVLGIQDPSYKFIFQELYDPHALSVVGVNVPSEHVADRKVDEAIRIWAHCMETGEFPGYPLRTAYVDAPPYLEKEWLEREERDAEQNTPAIDSIAAASDGINF